MKMWDQESCFPRPLLLPDMLDLQGRETMKSCWQADSLDTFSSVTMFKATSPVLVGDIFLASRVQDMGSRFHSVVYTLRRSPGSTR